MNNCFFHLTKLPPLPQEYHEAVSTVNWLSPRQHEYAHSLSIGYCEYFYKTPLMTQLKKDFVKAEVNYYRTNPKSFYNWHKDTSNNTARECAINFVVTQNPGAMTLFRVDYYTFSELQIEICDYTFLRPTLFNVAMPHAVFNPSDFHRAILSISLWGKSFEVAKEYFSTLELDFYY